MWITNASYGLNTGVTVFKKQVDFSKKPEKCQLKISADTKYRLYINGFLASIGPCKPSEFHSYYHTVDVAPYLTEGKNDVCVLVLHLEPFPSRSNGQCSYPAILRGPYGALSIEGEPFTTDESWQSAYRKSFTLIDPFSRSMAGEFERIDFSVPDTEFESARVLSTDCTVDPWGQIKPFPACESLIPPLTYNKKSFVNAQNLSLENDRFVLDAGVHSTGTLKFKVKGENGTKVKITYSEAFWKQDENGKYYKKQRDDATGIVYGSSDELILDGNEHVFETFFWRCFRYIEVLVTGKAELCDIEFYEMKYPLETDAYFLSSDIDSQKLWEVSVRTLNNCMHDSFEDCPYFEQLQYVMDSRLQALFLRYLTGDRRLINKCITDFNEGRFPDGMIPARTPSFAKQIIPGFALHYIYMLHDSFIYDGDVELIKDLLPTVDGIIRWFEKRTDNGIVGPVGVWSYLDWVKTWSSGVPTTTGSISIYNFMYILALKNAAELAEFAGRKGLEEEYLSRAAKLEKATHDYFYSEEKKMYRDSEDNIFSLHGQVWAVLADVVTGEEAKALLSRAYNDKDLPVCSYSMMYFVFRAYEKAGLYHIAYDMLDKWRIMLKKNCTTWVEDDVGERSECHGWGSTPIYEFGACILGVRPLRDGTVEVRPYVYKNDFAEGKVYTPIGAVSVNWQKADGTLSLTVDAEKEVRIVLPDGSVHYKSSGTFTCKV